MRSLRADLSVSILASLGMLVAAIVGGQMLVVTTTPAVATAAPAPTMSCLDRPLAPIGSAGVSGTARLCFSVDAVTLTVDLASATGGDLYTAWLRFHDRPGMKAAGACPSVEGTTQEGPPLPSQIDAVTATADGTARLVRMLPGLHPSGNTELEALVLDHGPASVTATMDRTRQLLSWDGAWSPMSSLPATGAPGRPLLLGCAAFWLRGGAELTDH